MSGFVHLVRPIRTRALNSPYIQTARSLTEVDLVRDEEVVGSNPATPTEQNSRSGPVLPHREPALISFSRPLLENS
jgi:hypothetical protein